MRSASVDTGSHCEPLDPGRLCVWIMRTDGPVSHEAVSRLEGLLPLGERVEARRYRRDADQRQFILSRALVRVVLSRHLPVPPDEWRFERDGHGRPSISGPVRPSPVQFSLSHTRGLIACLVTRSVQAAVDVERIEYVADLSRVAQQVLSPGERAALGMPSSRNWTTRFYEHWTLKEAYAKARGLGLALTLSDIGFELRPDDTIAAHFAARVADDSSAWRFWRRHLSPRHVLSVAAGNGVGGECEVILRPITVGGASIMLSG